MDEINEKAIKDIIDYYDSMKDVRDSEEEFDEEELKKEEEAPALVDIVEAKMEEKSEAAPVEEEQNDENTEPVEEETQSDEEEIFEFDDEEETSDEDDIIGDDTQSQEETENEADAEEKPKLTLVTDLVETEEEGKKKEEPKKKKLPKALIIAAVVVALLASVLAINMGFVENYKKNATKNITILFNFFGIDISRHNTEMKSNSDNTQNFKASVRNTATVPMENAGQSVFAGYRGGVVCAYMNYMTLISNDGSTIWENTTTIVNPLLKTAGNYILIAEKGGTKLCLYNDSRLIYEAETEDSILSCSVSSSGDVVAVTDKTSYKGEVIVFNRSGNRIFAWASGRDNVISADISSVSRRVAVALFNTDDKVRSMVELFDINEEESPAQVIFEDTIIFRVAFNGDTLGAFGDNCITGITSKGELLYDKRFDGVEFVHYGVDGAGNKILLFDNSNIPLINIYNIKGELKNQLSPEELPDFVDISGKNIVYNSGRNIIFGKAGAKSLKKYTASMDIKELIMLDDNTFVIVYSNNIEIVKV